jgi:hypothetical protein
VAGASTRNLNPGSRGQIGSTRVHGHFLGVVEFETGNSESQIKRLERTGVFASAADWSELLVRAPQ